MNREDTLYAIGALWDKYPAMRFMQLVDYIAWNIKKDHTDMYYLEDEHLVRKIKELTEKRS